MSNSGWRRRLKLPLYTLLVGPALALLFFAYVSAMVAGSHWGWERFGAVGSLAVPLVMLGALGGAVTWWLNQ